MNEQQEERICEPIERTSIEKKLDAAGWGLFFVWVGIAWLTGINLGVALLGVAAITLGAQLVRVALKLKAEGFWVVIGLCFAIGGMSHLTDQEAPILPILLIIAGAALLLTLFRRRRHADSPTK